MANLGVGYLFKKKYVTYENNRKEQSELNKNEFEKNSDISSMYSSIKKSIISQDEQIMKILTSIFKNQKVINSNLDDDLIAKLKENILVCGPTETGKTKNTKKNIKIT